MAGTTAGGTEEVDAANITLFPRTSSICMFRRSLTLAAALLLTSVVATDSQAQGVGPSPFGFGFQPFGFYQPYGATFGTSLRTPPHFALNPPVYYGARHARPYGLSPFAAPPVAAPGPNYQSRLRTEFIDHIPGQTGSSPPSTYAPAPGCSTYTHRGQTFAAAAPMGKIQSNPFVNDDTKLAQK